MKPTIAMSCLLSIALLATTSSGYTQNREGFGKDDPGVDVAVVIATKANLRDGPGTSSAVLREVNRGEMLALVNRARRDDDAIVAFYFQVQDTIGIVRDFD